MTTLFKHFKKSVEVSMLLNDLDKIFVSFPKSKV